MGATLKRCAEIYGSEVIKISSATECAPEAHCSGIRWSTISARPEACQNLDANVIQLKIQLDSQDICYLRKVQ